jgi:hypothetical protein
MSTLQALSLTLRSATTSDISLLAQLLAELFSLEQDFSVDVQAQQRGLALLLEQPGATVAVAESAGQIVGMATMQQLISTAEGGVGPGSGECTAAVPGAHRLQAGAFAFATFG